MTKIGRNEPCPCGSGKKHKRCCYGKTALPFIPDDAWKQDPEWYKIRLTEAEVVEGVFGFGVKQFGEDFLKEAMREFTLWGDYPFDQRYGDSIFVPWAAFDWIPEIDEIEYEQPLALDYLDEQGEQLDDYQQRFIRAACSQPFSFFSVTDVVAGKSLALRDVFLDREFTVKEAQATRKLKRGDIIFARVVPLDDQAVLVGMAPIALPPRDLSWLLDVREDIKKDLRSERLKLNLENLGGCDSELRGAYFSAVEFLANPPRTELQNTDGDPISFVKLDYEINCSSQEAFDGLRALSFYQEGILDDAIRDENGNLLEANIDWARKGNKKHKNWDNTILGTLTIKGNTLTAEVNSEKRAKKIQSEIAKRLGALATFKSAVHESVGDKLEEIKAQSGTPAFEEARRKQEKFESLPEVQAVVKAQMEAHWEGWYNERIPVLHDKTPLEAARTKAGRERLEALLLDFERRNEDVPHPELRVDVAAMRKKLGL